MLDPACGPGNCLHLTLHALKDIEHRGQLEAEALGLARAFPEIGQDFSAFPSVQHFCSPVVAPSGTRMGGGLSRHRCVI